MEKLKIWKTHPSNQIPKKQTEGSACFDLQFQGNGKNEYKGFTRNNKPFTRTMNNLITIQPGDRIMVPTGLIMDIPEGHSVRVHARSGLSLKQGLVLANAEGVIDSDYVEELMVLMWNISDNQINISNGDRIAQAELIKDESYSIVETAARPGVKTNRVGGMGSTGVETENSTVIINIPEYKVPKNVKSVHQDWQEKQEKMAKRGRGRPRKNASST
jgi:dUTP pyrophosphatase